MSEPTNELPGILDTQQAYGIIDPDYARIYSKVRCTVWMYGYTAIMHGSFTRDLDILIVPWTDKVNTDPQHMVNLICDRCNLRENGHPPDLKPHGRLSYTLMFKEFGDPRFVDISFMPTMEPKEDKVITSKDVNKLSLAKITDLLKVAQRLKSIVMPDPNDERDINIEWLKKQVLKASNEISYILEKR